MPPQPPIQSVIFDYGLVLAHTLDPTPRARWEQQLGLAPGSLTTLVHDNAMWVAAQQGRITSEAHWQSVGHTLNLSTTQLTALRADFYRGDVVNLPLVAAIDRLRHGGVRIGLLSNFSTDLRPLLLQQNLLQRFDSIAISAEIGVMKPDPVAYQAILQMLEVPASATVFIDDLPVNVTGAASLGIQGVVFRDTTSCLHELAAILGYTI